jgi:hypothetical protein
MKFFTFILLIVLPLALSAQTVIFSEDFESGTPNSAWELYRVGEEAVQAVDMASAPAALANGGNYVGMIQDTDLSYTGAALALAGSVSDANYTIEADVYCYVNQPVSAYTGLVFYADSSHQGTQSHGIYYKLVADFDASNRFRLYNNQLDFTTFAYTFHEAIDATGLYTGDAWHNMKVVVSTVNDTTVSMECYFDDQLLGLYYDTSSDARPSGQFGIYVFNQVAADPLAGYFDNIVVTQNATAIEDDETVLPQQFSLEANYPNPFNPSTTIRFTLDQTEDVNLTVYNTSGQVVKSLVNGSVSAGQHEVKWNATDISGNTVASGIYLYTLRAGNKTETRRMIFLK